MSGSESRLAIRSAVERGADLNYHVNAVGRTPLIFAIEYFWAPLRARARPALADARTSRAAQDPL